MEATLSPGFTDRVLDRIFFEHELRIGAVRRRYGIGERFALPFSYTVVHGLYSGERREGFFLRVLREHACDKEARIAYDDSDKPLMRLARIFIKDLFGVAYRLGREFSDVSGFRKEGIVKTLSPEQGAVFVSAMAQGLSLDVLDVEGFSQSIWSEYASNRAPRLSVA